jgi:hypothetical protein
MFFDLAVSLRRARRRDKIADAPRPHSAFPILGLNAMKQN